MRLDDYSVFCLGELNIFDEINKFFSSLYVFYSFIKTYLFRGIAQFFKKINFLIKRLRHQIYDKNFRLIYFYVRKAINWHEFLKSGSQII